MSQGGAQARTRRYRFKRIPDNPFQFMIGPQKPAYSRMTVSPFSPDLLSNHRENLFGSSKLAIPVLLPDLLLFSSLLSLIASRHGRS